MKGLSVEDFIANHLNKYSDAMQRLAHQKECEFRIHVYERSDDYIACIDNDKTKWESASSINKVIDKLKISFPELSEEYGVKYYPLSKFY